MEINIPKGNSENYVEALMNATEDIKLRAEEIIGDVGGQTAITITINLNPHEIPTYDVYKTFIAGWKLIKKEESV